MSVDLDLEQPQEPEPEGGGGGELITRLLAGPGVSLIVMALVSLATWTGIQANNADPFVLQAPLAEDWWQLPLSVFSHQGPTHLSSNATMVAIFGALVVISSSVFRYHLFFITTGIASGAAQVMATDALGDAGAVLGASGAAMGLIGYVITSNTISSVVLKRVPWWGVAILVVAVAVALAIWSAALQIANVAHLTGALIGAVAGYFHLLRAG
jgi:membrane associated rhomboid family serine protease